MTEKNNRKDTYILFIKITKIYTDFMKATRFYITRKTELYK